MKPKLLLDCPMPGMMWLRLADFPILILLLPFLLFPYSLTLSGPSLANVPLANPLLANFATAAAPSVPIILDLFCSTVLLMLLIAPDKSPPKACCTEVANPVDCAKDRAVPASIALMLNERLALRLGALRLAAIRPYGPYYLKDLPCVVL